MWSKQAHGILHELRKKSAMSIFNISVMCMGYIANKCVRNQMNLIYWILNNRNYSLSQLQDSHNHNTNNYNTLPSSISVLCQRIYSTGIGKSRALYLCCSAVIMNSSLQVLSTTD
jgi:hypothetical protein